MVQEKCPIGFWGHPSNVMVMQYKNSPILTWIESVSRLLLQFELTDGHEMMHKARSSIEEVSYCFSRSSDKFQDHMICLV